MSDPLTRMLIVMLAILVVVVAHVFAMERLEKGSTTACPKRYVGGARVTGVSSDLSKYVVSAPQA